MDKYQGSELTDTVLTKTLTDFLYDGVCHHIELIPHLLVKLKRLRDVMTRLSGYRMFSSSLLIMYEGNNLPHSLSKSDQSHVFDHQHEYPCTGSTRVNNSTPDPTHLNNSVADPMIKNCTTTTTVNPDPVPSPSDLVDIRMIDFGNFSSDHEGPDIGYILGLDSIIRIYEEFLMKHQS